MTFNQLNRRNPPLSESSSWTGDAAGRARETVGDTAQRAGDKAREAGATVQERVRDQVGERSTTAGEQADQVSQAVRDMSGQLRSQGNDLPSRAAEEVANRVEQFARYLRESDGNRIMSDIEDFGRRQPLVVAAVGLAAGVVAARLLKASGSRSRDTDSGTQSRPAMPPHVTSEGPTG
jgi:hypothetical protein